jgi:hypothetical protein
LLKFALPIAISSKMTGIGEQIAKKALLWLGRSWRPLKGKRLKSVGKQCECLHSTLVKIDLKFCRKVFVRKYVDFACIPMRRRRRNEGYKSVGFPSSYGSVADLGG